MAKMRIEKDKELEVMQERIDELEVRYGILLFVLSSKTKIKQGKISSRQTSSSPPRRYMVPARDSAARTNLMESLRSIKRRHKGISAKTILKVVPEEVSHEVDFAFRPD